MTTYTFERMNDKNIKLIKNKIRRDDIHEWHEASRNFIGSLPMLQNGAKWILITHHVPYLPCHTKDIQSDIWDDGYYTNMKLDSTKISHSIHGHNHHQADFMLNGIRYLSNPFGYNDEKHVRERYDENHHFHVSSA